jgi:hypothetical protein
MTAPRLAWGLFGAWLALALGTASISARTGDIVEMVYTPSLLVFAAVGALIAARRPEHPIGWLLLAAAFAFAATSALEEWVKAADSPPSAALWADDWMFLPWIALACVWIPLVFPDGRLPSRRWRPVAWALAALFATALLGRAFGDRTLDTNDEQNPANPFALPGVAGDIAAHAAWLSEPGIALGLLTALIAVVLRLRRSHGVERQQLKWFAFAGALMLCALFVGMLSLLLPERIGEPIGSVGWGGFLLVFVIGLPLALGAAILRHNLYDIDVVIRRTLVYGTLTATLGAAYLALVLLAGLAVGESDVAIAASTLAVAALFRPARARIQAAVDRRFFRRRYDAGRTLDAFGARLRDQLDLDAVGADLRAAVHDTVQPAHVSLWLRGDG